MRYCRRMVILYLKRQINSFFEKTHLAVDMYAALHSIVLTAESQCVIKIIVHFPSLSILG
jgi:AAA15 family ATPase/GTPase